MMWLVLGAFLWGMPVAWAFGKYMIKVAAKEPGAAAGYDLAIMLMANLTMMTWLESDNHLVLVAYSMGNATGTYLVTRFGHAD